MPTTNGSGSGILGLAVIPSMADTFGAILLGTFVGFMLYGLSVHQTYRYFRMYPTDITLMKALVLVLFLADTLHSIQCVHMCYYYLVSNHFRHEVLTKGVWSIRLLIPVTNFMIIVAQCFYARRVFLIGTRWIYVYVVALSGILMLGAIGFATAATIETFIQQTLLNWKDYTWLTSAAFTFALVTDVILTASLIAFLRSCRTGFKRTDGLLKVLIVYTINTGLFTSTLSLLSLIFAFAMPGNLIYAGLSIPATKSYATSVLSILNSRKSLASWPAGTSGEDDFGTFGMSVLRRHRFTNTDLERRPFTLPTAVVDIRTPTRMTPGNNPIQPLEDVASVDESDHKAGSSRL